jgi:putative hydrolase of the HAD superfamily
VALITLDALGTLVELRAPAPALVSSLGARGIAVSEAQAAAALAREIAYYRAHHDEAADLASLARLRGRCAAVLREALEQAGADVSSLTPSQLLDALLAALRFRAYPEVPGALHALRAAGHRLVVVSNWDVSLHETLRATGLAALVDGAISSAEAGAAKPDPRIFSCALALGGGCGGDAGRLHAGDSTQRAVAGRDARLRGTHVGESPNRGGGMHVGDSLEHDVAGARAAGLRPVLVVRDGRPPEVPADVAVIDSLAELAALAA